MNPSLILISESAEDGLFTQEVATRSGLPLLKCGTPENALDSCRNTDEQIFFVDVSTPEKLDSFLAVYKGRIGTGASQINPNHLHFITFDTPECMSLMARSNLLGHFIVRNYGDPAEAGRHYGRLVHGLCRGTGSGLDRLFPPPGKVSSVLLRHSSDKKEAITKLTDLLTNETGFKGRQISLIVNAVDELLMNAIYDAPTDEKGEQELRKVRRDTPLELAGQRLVEMQVGFDGEYAAVTVIDRFGSIDKTRLLRHILDNHSMHVRDQAETTDAGAGIGLATTFRLGGSLFFMQEPGSRTEATVFFKVTPTFKEFRSQFRFLSIHVG